MKEGDDVDNFESLLDAERVFVQRFVKFRINSKADAEDVLQEVFLSAYQKFPQLKLPRVEHDMPKMRCCGVFDVIPHR